VKASFRVSLRSELNELEQQNIAEANAWAFQRKRDVLNEAFLRGLHRRMFNRVWQWAGRYRTTERKLGISPHLIQISLLQAIDDARTWVEYGSYNPDELAVRFHHRIVSVHPFSNGNGRWSRLSADLLITAQGGERFSWGAANLQAHGITRKAYIDACAPPTVASRSFAIGAPSTLARSGDLESSAPQRASTNHSG